MKNSGVRTTGSPNAAGDVTDAPVAAATQEAVPPGDSEKVLLDVPMSELRTAVSAVTEALKSVQAVLAKHARTITPGDEKKYCGITDRRLAVVPQVAEMLRKYPDLVPGVSPEEMLSTMQDATALDGLTHDFNVLGVKTDSTATLCRADVWRMASLVYGVACTKAKQDKQIAIALAPIREALKTGSKIDSTARNADLADHKLAKAHARATLAQGKAEAARASHVRATEASAARRKAKGR